MAPTTKVKVENLHLYNKTVIDFNFGRHKDLSTRKMIFTEASSLFCVDKILMSISLKPIIV